MTSAVTVGGRRANWGSREVAFHVPFHPRHHQEYTNTKPKTDEVNAEPMDWSRKETPAPAVRPLPSQGILPSPADSRVAGTHYPTAREAWSAHGGAIASLHEHMWDAAQPKGTKLGPRWTGSNPSCGNGLSEGYLPDTASRRLNVLRSLNPEAAQRLVDKGLHTWGKFRVRSASDRYWALPISPRCHCACPTCRSSASGL